METRLYFQMLRRGWWMIVLTTLTALVVSLAATYVAVPQYQAVARFIVSPSNQLINGTEVLNSLATLNSQSVMSTYAEVMSSARIYNDTLAFLQLKPRDLKDYTYQATVVSSSSVIELTVKGPDPNLAAKIANTLGEQTINFTSNLNQVFTVGFLDVAVPPIVPVSPKPLVNAGLAVVVGLVIGSGLAILNEQLRIPLESFRQRLHLDNLTGVYNNKYFSRLVEEELTRNPDNVLSIGIVELDGLRDLLETFPLAGLQKVFHDVTETLRKELRGNDVIGLWNDISFIVMLPNTTGAAANGIFERIYQALSQPVNFDSLGIAVHLDAHIGGAEYGNNASSQELLDTASKGLEQARRDPSNPVYIRYIKSGTKSEKSVVKS
jgi:diguanylate cyclase (GGDEF)-like protein